METVITSRPLPDNKRIDPAVLLSRIRPVEGDLLAQDDVEAIVVALPPDLSCEGTLCQAVMAASDGALDVFLCENMIRPRAGDVYAAPALGLSVEHVLFVIMPRWRNDFDRNDRDLTRAYRAVIRTAQEMGLKRIAFPVLGTGEGYKSFPPARAARLAIQAIADRLFSELEEVRIVCRDAAMRKIFMQAVRNSESR